MNLKMHKWFGIKPTMLKFMSRMAEIPAALTGHPSSR
jgi:hypothetical protein